MRGHEAPMDLDTPRGYSPCWLDESPPKNEITDNRTQQDVKMESPVSIPSVIQRTPVPFATGNTTSATKARGGKRSPFYTASPLSGGKVVKNSFFRRLRSATSDDEQTDDSYGSKSTGFRKRNNFSSSFFQTDGAHSTQHGRNHLYLPFVLMGYLQVLFNGIIIAGVLYFAVQFALTIRRDVEIKVEEQLSNIMSEISHCSKQYIENRCSPELRVPAMEKACMAWETCMKRDPSTTGRARLHAETFAEVINSLVDPISYKTMLFILLGVFGAMFISNYAFNAARHRAAAESATKSASAVFPGSSAVTPVSPFVRKLGQSRSQQNVHCRTLTES